MHRPQQFRAEERQHVGVDPSTGRRAVHAGRVEAIETALPPRSVLLEVVYVVKCVAPVQLDITGTASARARNTLCARVQRLHALPAINASVMAGEVVAAATAREATLAALAKARPRVDAVRMAVSPGFLTLRRRHPGQPALAGRPVAGAAS